MEEIETKIKGLYRQIEASTKDLYRRIEAFNRRLGDDVVRTEQISEVTTHLVTFERFVVGVLLVGFIVILIELASILIDFFVFKFSYYKYSKTQNAQKVVIDNLQEQKSVVTSIQNLEKKIEELKLCIGITKAISDVSNGQKLLTNSVQNLEKELKELYRNEKGIANILSEQKTLAILVRNLQEELKELKGLYRIEKNTDDIINSQNRFIDSFQSLEKEVHKLNELSQDYADPNMIDKSKITDDLSQKIKEELKNILQILENRRTEAHYQKIIYH